MQPTPAQPSHLLSPPMSSASSQLPTMTSLSTPGTSVKELIDQQAAAAQAVAMSTRTPHTGSTATTVTPRATLSRRAVVVRVAGAVVVILLAAAAGLLFINGKEAHNELRSYLPVRFGDNDPASLELQNTVQAFLRGDLAATALGIQHIEKMDPGEPSVLILQALILDQHAVAERRALLTRLPAASAQVIFHLYNGTDIAELLADGYDRTPEDLIKRLEGCRACKKSVVTLVAVAEMLATTPKAEAALEIYDRAIGTSPNVALPYVLKSTMLMHNAQPALALGVATLGLERVPDSPALLLASGTAKLGGGQFHEAIDDLKRSVEQNGGIDAQLELAHAYILVGDEAGRATTIAGVLRAATPLALCRIARLHGTALVGAGRGDDALALFNGCYDSLATLHSAPDPQLIAELKGAFMSSLEDFDALNDTALWRRMYADAAKRLGPMLTSESTPKAIEGVANTLIKLSNGDTKGADEGLKKLEALEDSAWPPHARDAILSLVSTRVLPAVNDFTGAINATRNIQRRCGYHSRRAAIFRAEHSDVEAADEIARIMELASYCRSAEYQGAYLLEALVTRAEMDAEKNPKQAVDQLDKAMQDLFPNAVEGALVTRAAAVIGHGAPW